MRSAAPASTSACVSASSNCATAVRKRGVSHSRGCSSTEISSILATKVSLFSAHLQREAGDARHDDGLAGANAILTDRLPDLSANAHPAVRPAIAHRNALGPDQSLRADYRTPALREADAEARLAELDRHPDDDRRDSPARRQDEHGQEDG